MELIDKKLYKSKIIDYFCDQLSLVSRYFNASIIDVGRFLFQPLPYGANVKLPITK